MEKKFIKTGEFIEHTSSALFYGSIQLVKNKNKSSDWKQMKPLIGHIVVQFEYICLCWETSTLFSSPRIGSNA